MLEELGLAVECRGLVDAWTYRAGGAEGTVVIVVYDCAPRARGGHDAAAAAGARSTASARWFDVAALDGIEMPEPYKRSIRAASRRR